MTSDFRSGSQSSQRIRGFADCRLERTRKNADHPAPALSPLFHVVQLQRSKQSMMSQILFAKSELQPAPRVLSTENKAFGCCHFPVSPSSHQPSRLAC